MADEKMTEKQREARDSLKPEQQEAFDEIVREYKFYTEVNHGRGYVSYPVLADMIRHGWRYCAEFDESAKREEA